MKYFKKVIGKRIYLSPRSPEDTEIFTKWLNDNGLMSNEITSTFEQL